MQTKSIKKSGLKVRPNIQIKGTFELKATNGRSLGFIMNGDRSGPSFAIAGYGPETRSVFQQVLLWPATKVLRGRLALILLDTVNGELATAALRDVTELLSPVRDSLFLTSLEVKHPRAQEASIQTIEKFCAKYALFSVKASGPDCASL